MTSEYKAEGLIPRVVRGWGRVPDARVWGFIPERGFDPRWWEQASSPAAAPVPTYTPPRSLYTRATPKAGGQALEIHAFYDMFLEPRALLRRCSGWRGLNLGDHVEGAGETPANDELGE